MRTIATILLATTALAAAPALAQTAPAAAANASGVDAANIVDADDGESIVVFGRGETRQVQELDNRALTILAPGTSPLKAIEKLPSVNFQSADPFGLYEWSQRVSIRSFNQNQLGFTLDGIPLGDGTYGNNNGLHISRAISPDNIGITRVSQGAGSIGTQATNNLGGTIEFFSADPKGEFGIETNLTYGSSDTKRVFTRVNAGAPDGVRGFASFAWIDAGKWKGNGKQRQYIGNAKVIIPVGDAAFDGYISYSDRAEQDYQDLSLGQIRRLGYRWDNLFPDYTLAVRLADIGVNRGDISATPQNPGAGTVYPGAITSVDDAYYDASGLRRDALGSLGLTAPLRETVTFKIKGYYHDNKGQGTWFTPYVPSSATVPISVRTTEYDIQRGGVFGSLGAKISPIYELTVGGWYEHNDFRQARRFYALTSRTNPGRSALNFMRNPLATQWDFNFNTDTLQYHVANRFTLGDATINLGWKGFSVNNEAVPQVQGSLAAGTIKSRDWFQPHVGAAYRSGDTEFFAGFTQVTRAFVSSATSGPFSTTQAGFNAIRSTLKPEESDTYELGARYNSARFNGSVGVYYVNFRNRLLGFANGAGIVGNPSVLQNVGDVRSYGFEAAGDYRVGNGFTLFASYAYNDSTYRDDVFNALNVRVAQTKGKTTVDSPQHLLRGEIAYDSQTLFARIGANYMSKRFFTYENDQSVAGRALVDATLGYRFDLGLAKPVELQLNATNLFDLAYVATIGSNGFGNRGDNQTLLAGAPRQVFVTLKAGF